MPRLALLLLAMIALSPWAGRAEDNLELAVKATYLVKFQPFVTWPPAAFPRPDSPFVLCVAGRHPFGPLLDRAIAGQSVDGRTITLRRLEMPAAEAGCHILYVAPGDPAAAKRAIEAVRGQPVLTVTDAEEREELQGMLNFVMTDGRVRFTIDEDAARESGLDISSKLLRLAISVRRGAAK